MKKFLCTVLAVGALTACSTTKYQIEGHTSLTNLDGKKIYVKTVHGEDLNDLDSCEIVHGRFAMEGALDTVHMAVLFMDDQSLMPLVLEPASMVISIADTAWRVTGTEMNDQLYEFLHAKGRLEGELQELPRRENRMILDGKDEYEIQQVLSGEVNRIQQSYDKLVMKYVTSNFDNMLSVGVFMMHTMGQPPLLTPQIEDIMSKATQVFKDDPYIKWYIQAAESNMRSVGR